MNRTRLRAMRSWLSRELIAVLSLVITVPLSVIALFHSCTTTELARIDAEAQWSVQYQAFVEADRRIIEWEGKRGFQRAGPPADSISDLRSRLEPLDLPADIARDYEARHLAYDSMQRFAEQYTPFSSRLGDLQLSLPKAPGLPSGLFAPLGTLDPRLVRCCIGGLFGRCEDVLGPEGLRFPAGLFSDHMPARVPLSFRAFRTPGGTKFDMELFGIDSKPVVSFSGSEWTLHDPSLRHASDEDKIEVIDREGNPLIQIFLDQTGTALYFGGNLYSADGELIQASPRFIRSKKVLLADAKLEKGGLKWSAGLAIAQPPAETFELPAFILGQEVDFNPRPEAWFSYGDSPQLNERSFARVLTAIDVCVRSVSE